MAKQYTLNERDSKRVQDALRFVERNKNLKPDYRRRNFGGGRAVSENLTYSNLYWLNKSTGAMIKREDVGPAVLFEVDYKDDVVLFNNTRTLTPSASAYNLAKYTKNLNIVWGFHTKPVYATSAQGLKIDSLGNIYISATTSPLWGGDKNIWKLDTNGNLIWSYYIPAVVYEIYLAPPNYIYISHSRYYDNPNYYSLTKLDGNGNLIWRIDAHNLYRDVKTDVSGNVYVAGTRSDFGGATYYTIAKYDSGGNLLDGADLGSGVGAIFHIDLDKNGNIYASSTLSGNYDYTFYKVAADFSLAWQKNLYGPISNRGNCVLVDNDNNVYVGLYTSYHNNGDGIDRLYKFDSGGNVLWQTPVYPTTRWFSYPIYDMKIKNNDLLVLVFRLDDNIL